MSRFVRSNFALSGDSAAFGGQALRQAIRSYIAFEPLEVFRFVMLDEAFVRYPQTVNELNRLPGGFVMPRADWESKPRDVMAQASYRAQEFAPILYNGFFEVELHEFRFQIGRPICVEIGTGKIVFDEKENQIKLAGSKIMKRPTASEPMTLFYNQQIVTALQSESGLTTEDLIYITTQDGRILRI